MDAEKYDSWYDRPLGAACFRSESALLRLGAGDLAGKAVLEVGCGSGRFLEELARDSARAVGVDREAGILALARRRTGSDAGHRFAWVRGEASSLPFAQASFDLVFENTVLCRCADPRPVLREMVRVCRPGGKVLLGELNPTAPWQWWRRLKGALGVGSFAGASWHRPRDLLAALAGAGCRAEQIGRAIFWPPLDLLDRWGWRSAAERLGRRLWPVAAAYYVLGARRDEGLASPRAGAT